MQFLDDFSGNVTQNLTKTLQISAKNRLAAMFRLLGALAGIGHAVEAASSCSH
jgi:hypothetical protein